MIHRSASVLAACVLIAGCGSPISVEDHLAEVESVFRVMQRESIAALPQVDEITFDGISGVNEARRAAFGALDSMEAPDDVAPEHAALVAALGDLVSVVDEFLDRHSDLSAAGFTTAVLEAGEIELVVMRVTAACEAMAERATDLGLAFTC